MTYKHIKNVGIRNINAAPPEATLDYTSIIHFQVIKTSLYYKIIYATGTESH